MRQFLAWAKATDPFEGVRLPEPENQEARAWTDEEMGMIREAADGHGPLTRLAIELAVATGARKQELFALEWGALDADACAVRITRQLDPNGGTRRLKSNKARTAVVLPSWWAHHREGAKGLILPDPPRRGVVGAVLRDAGLAERGVAWHSFRHTYARIFLDLTHDILLLKESLGHGSVGITESTYKHFDTDRAASKARELIYANRPPLKVV